MNIWPFILTIIAGLSTVIGCLFTFIKIKNKDNFIVVCLSISISVMILVSIFDLMPEAFRYIDIFNIRGVGEFVLFFILGIVIVNIIDNIVKRVEKGDLYKIGILNFIALMMHNLPEGILTYMSTYEDFRLGLDICIAISLHNIPEGIAIALPIYYETKSRVKALILTLFSSFAEIFGAVITYIFLKHYIDYHMISLFLVLVAGIMITVSINKMLPTVLKYNNYIYMNIGLLIGLILVSIMIVI